MLLLLGRAGRLEGTQEVLEGVGSYSTRSLRCLWPDARLLWDQHPLLRLLAWDYHGSRHGHGLLWGLAWDEAWLLSLSCLHGPRSSRPLSWGHAGLHDLWSPGPWHHLHGWLHWSRHALLWLLRVHGQAVHVDPVVLLVLLGLCHHLDLPCHLDSSKGRLLLQLLRCLGRLGKRGLLLV